MENFESIQSLIFVFNKELGLQDSEIYNMSWHSMIKKYSLLKEYWREQEKQNKEMEAKMKSKRK